ncbi:hypothetical protein RJ640_027609 [Escallonia rubra]|uniref:Myb-like domain-containing protein n=1 Tax=Escallonia rubra TaxID=112253 RepID=A0AA88R5L9_9ASTE|nr:hypothetical protein RJ640_027609 [Escallonia rubra]
MHQIPQIKSSQKNLKGIEGTTNGGDSVTVTSGVGSGDSVGVNDVPAPMENAIEAPPLQVVNVSVPQKGFIKSSSTSKERPNSLINTNATGIALSNSHNRLKKNLRSGFHFSCGGDASNCGNERASSYKLAHTELANPSGTRHEAAQPSHASFNGNNPVVAPDCSTDWTAEEQSVLEEGLTQYASETNIIRYAKIARQLQNKSVRDVAFRCRWMTKKEANRRKKEDHHSLTRKIKDKKLPSGITILKHYISNIVYTFDKASLPLSYVEKVINPSAKSSQFSVQPGFPSYVQGVVTNNNEDGLLYNVWTLKEPGRVPETEPLVVLLDIFFSKMLWPWDKFLQTLKRISLNDVPDVRQQMPPLPVKPKGKKLHYKTEERHQFGLEAYKIQQDLALYPSAYVMAQPCPTILIEDSSSDQVKAINDQIDKWNDDDYF